VLILQGSVDLQVPVAAAQELAAARPDAQLVVIDGMNHLMKMVGQDAALQQHSYVGREPAVAQRVIDAIATFAKGKIVETH
jgi:pimeloyl-ACP methyl ester carboxylesterase